MKIFRYLAVSISILTFASVAFSQVFYDNSGVNSSLFFNENPDEWATAAPFTGIHHVASFTFMYDNVSATPTSAVVKFYNVDPVSTLPGALVASIPVNNLTHGFEQIVTVNLDPSQQFDWAATPNLMGSGESGGYVSMQFPGGQSGWVYASGAALDGIFDLTTNTGARNNFGGDPIAAFYLQVSGVAAAPALSAINLNPTAVRGGRDSQGTVSLTNASVSGATIVKLFSSNPNLARIPTQVTIPQGSTSASFRIQTQGLKTTTKVSISASSNGVLKLATLTLNP